MEVAKKRNNKTAEIEILYEDDDIVAVNKPAGLVVHSDGKTAEPSLSDWVLEKYPQTKSVGEPARTPTGKMVPRPGIVHRLDRETSGVLLVAKTEKGFDVLKKQFQAHEIKKTYEAFVFGEMKTDKGVIDRPIGRSASDFRQWSAQRGARGEMHDAVTEYVVKARAGGYSLVEVFPKTGRTHQIRVHFKAINYPLVADSLYAPGRENALGFTRLALHSRAVSFENVAGEKISVVAPYPPDFEKAISAIGK
jgi:23S rRNA pseudouridine1911/1915/1917 synthase